MITHVTKTRTTAGPGAFRGRTVRHGPYRRCGPPAWPRVRRPLGPLPPPVGPVSYGPSPPHPAAQGTDGETPSLPGPAGLLARIFTSGPQAAATAKQVGAPGSMRRSFRTLRLCAIPRGFTPGWYAVPRWGTPNASPTQSPSAPHASTTTELFDDDYFSSSVTINHPHRGTGPQSTQRQRDRAGTSIGGDHQKPIARSAKAPPPPSLPASAGPIPRSALEALIPSASPGTLPPQNR